MKNIVMTLAGGMLIALLADILLPEKGVKKQARFAVGILISLILVSPILEIFQLAQNPGSFALDETFLSQVDKGFTQMEFSAIEKHLLQSCDISAVLSPLDDGMVLISVTEKGERSEEETVKVIAEILRDLQLPLSKTIIKFQVKI